MSVKVGVRVRPFNKRQEQLNSKCCVQMNGNTTHLISQDSQTKSFVYDYSFWSHDKFMVDPDGIYIPVDEKYADQKKVYDQIGSEILVNAWQGYNCCLFAYGQTGSGKSYSMLGYGQNRGIIPMVCDEIFLKIKSETDERKSYEIKVSMMEIYNETLRDLLSHGKNKKNDLKICEHKKLGVYVEGLNKHSVKNYQQIEKKIEEGSNNRSIAATLMNESSSRSHTIVSISFVQRTQLTNAQTGIKYSTIHLVDLAGSQSVGKTGVDSKDRLREAAKINQSLSTLGRVIEILAENSARTDKIFVPYRDSKLTFILRNALGGNSRTAMICAISPADDNYQQTLSTLRYAQRAKKIQNKAMVNQSDVDKLIRMLREQNQMLKKMLREAKFNKTVINMQMISNVQQMNKNMADMGVIPQDENIFDDDEDLLSNNDQNSSFSENNISSIMDFGTDKFDESQPHITNVSEDELLSGRLKYSCAKALTIGNKSGQPRPDVVLHALGIQPLHAKIINEENKIYLFICQEQAAQYTYLNGDSIPFGDKIELMNMDRLIFGTGCVFLVKIKDGQIRVNKNNSQFQPSDIDYQFAITEMQENQGFQKNNNKKAIAEEEEIRRKILEGIQAQYEKMKNQNEELLKKKLQQQQSQYSLKIKQIEDNKTQEMKRLEQQLNKQSSQALKLREDKKRIEDEIEHFKQIEQKIKQSTIQDKQALENARKALQQKMNTIKDLQTNLSQIQTKQQEMKRNIEEKQIIIRKQLQVKMVLCNNQNILNDYKLELSKKMKNTSELKELLVKKQRIQLQKQLLELVPMVEKFNLIAKEMEKEIQCGLSVEYQYIGDLQILQVLKSGSYKNKIKILIHVFNKAERRSYIWSADVFRNRFQLAISMFQIFIRTPKDPQLLNRDADPFWDPPSPSFLGSLFISLEPLFYKLDYEGELQIVKKGCKIGSAYIKIFPIDPITQEDISPSIKQGITIYNPRDMVQKNLNFCLRISNVCLEKDYLYSSAQIQYTLMDNSYKKSVYKSPLEPTKNIDYLAFHCFSDLSQTTISQYIDEPLTIRIWGQLLQADDDELTTRNEDSSVAQSEYRASFDDKQISSFSSSQSKKSPKKGASSGIIVSNFDVMSKIDIEFNKQKQQRAKANASAKSSFMGQNNKKKSKDDCRLF